MAVINVLVWLMRSGRPSNESGVEKKGPVEDQREEQTEGRENHVSTLPTLETDLFSLKPQLQWWLQKQLY